MDSIEKSAKTVDDAVAEALKALNAEKDEVEITVLDQGAKGFLNIGSRLARVLVVKKFDPERAAKKFLLEISKTMGVEIEIKTKLTEKSLEVELVGNDMGIFIGKRGQTLDSLQYLVNLVVNKGNAPFVNVVLDTENYRKRRKETLESLAINLSKKVKTTKKSVVLEPMNPYERRIIHSTLQGDKLITTYSEGEEPYRNVVIALKR